MGTVREAIKSIKKFVVTKDGKILAINNITDKSLLDCNVVKMQVIPGVISDVVAVRI